MSILVAIKGASESPLHAYGEIIRAIADSLLPAAHSGLQTVLVQPGRSLLTAVLGRRDGVLADDRGLFAGIAATSGNEDAIWKIGSQAPAGSFVLIRTDADQLEAVTDFAGSRSLWYAALPCGGIAVSTSFEVVVALMGRFELNDEALGWFLSSGTAGPGISWDRNIKPLGRNSVLAVARLGDSITIRTDEQDSWRPRGELAVDKDLKRALDDTIGGLDFNASRWFLALSGGYDSRCLLSQLRHTESIRAVTWGDPGALRGTSNDVEIARRLAALEGREHQVKEIRRPETPEQFESAMRRFVRYCDGRIDNCLAYIDGMRFWDEICSEDEIGVIRGDELLGSKVSHRAAMILRNMRLTTFHEFAPDHAQNELVNRYSHEVPASLGRTPEESLSKWRWRLRLDHEIPTVYAAMSAVRSRFMESVSPLLTRGIVATAARLSDADLNNKAAFNRVVSELYPEVPIASDRAILFRRELFALEPIRQLLASHLRDSAADALLGQDVTRIAIRDLGDVGAGPEAAGGNLVATGNGRRLLTRIRGKLQLRPGLNTVDLALRSYLATIFLEEIRSVAGRGRDEMTRFINNGSTARLQASRESVYE
jgi:hypothetical protein